LKYEKVADTCALKHIGDMPKRSSNGARDLNQLAAAIVAASTDGEMTKNPAAVALGRLGGLIGGKARAASLSKKKRSEIAKKAAESRWKKNGTT
jgi:hypothetical protein